MTGLFQRRVHPGTLFTVLAGMVLTSMLVMVPAAAQPTGNVARVEAGPAWSSLTAIQRRQLEPLHAEWANIDATRKQKWLDVAARMPSMSPPEQDRVRVRMAEWARMSPAERGRARLQFQEARQLAPGDRQERWQAYQSLPADQRQALASKAAPATPKSAPNKRPPAPVATSSTKRNVVSFAPAPSPLRTVAPTVVQSRAGATTSLVTKSPSPPVHHQAGLPKIAATKSFVDQSTLLPKRGPQGAAVAVAPASAPRQP
jgi:hypothetical protein